MKKQYNRVKIEFENCIDIIFTSGEYLETDRSFIGPQTQENRSFNLLGTLSNQNAYGVSVTSYPASELYEF